MINFNKTKSCVLAALVAGLCLAGLPLAKYADAKTASSESCAVDAIRQSVCIYKAILANVDRNYVMRGGGGINRIVQNSTTSYSAYISQEGHEDVRTYEIEIAHKGKVTIRSVTENTETH